MAFNRSKINGEIIQLASLYADCDKSEFYERISNGDAVALNALKHAVNDIMDPALKNMSNAEVNSLCKESNERYTDTVRLMDNNKYEDPHFYTSLYVDLLIGQAANKYAEEEHEVVQSEPVREEHHEATEKHGFRGFVSKVKDFIFGDD